MLSLTRKTYEVQREVCGQTWGVRFDVPARWSEEACKKATDAYLLAPPFQILSQTPGKYPPVSLGDI